MFLMHRVELKVLGFSIKQDGAGVPNAPCGVERHTHRHDLLACKLVPNAPCGVESSLGEGLDALDKQSS